jgi:hypothetical protein
MIKYALACENAHEFEGWFGSSDAYDAQSEQGLVECPVCASHRVRKQIMAPAVAAARGRDAEMVDLKLRADLIETMNRVRRHVEESFDYVGDAFAKEARDIHEGKAEDRGIYGEASAKEVKALIEDGVKIAPLPPKLPPNDELN